MAWPRLQGRFVQWFSEALSAADFDLASAIASLVAAMSDVDALDRPGLRLLLDELEQAEPAAVRDAARPDLATIRDVVADLTAAFEDEGDDGRSAEAPIVYFKLRSSSRTNVLSVMPSATQISRSSRMSSRRSPVSYLLTND